MSKAGVRHRANFMLYTVYQTKVSPYASTTMINQKETMLLYASSYMLNQRANLWRITCKYVITTLVMLPHISKTGDTTYEASFHATVPIMLLIHPVLVSAGS